MFERIRSGELGHEFTVHALMATDGEWHRRYADVFERDMHKYDEVLLRELLQEMGTDEIHTDIKRRMWHGDGLTRTLRPRVSESSQSIVSPRWTR